MATRYLVRFGCDLRHLSRLRPAGGLCAGLRRRHPRRVRPFRPPRVPPSLPWCVRAGHQEAAVGEAEGGPGVFGWCRMAGRAAIATGTEHHTAGGPVREGMTRLASVPPALGPSAAGGGSGGAEGTQEVGLEGRYGSRRARPQQHHPPGWCNGHGRTFQAL